MVISCVVFCNCFAYLKTRSQPYLASIFLGVQSLLHRLRFISNFVSNLRKIHIQKLQVLHQAVVAHRQSALLEEASLRIRVETPSDRVHQNQPSLVLHAMRDSTALIKRDLATKHRFQICKQFLSRRKGKRGNSTGREWIQHHRIRSE